MGSPRTNLVTPLTSFVGRADDLAAIEERFDAGERLVTITGAAGIGKTRLAKQVAPRRHELLARGGVWFCDLSDARDQEAIAAVVGSVLDVPVAGRGETASAVERIGDAIGAREPSLIVLDNFEQATAHAPGTVGAWLTRAPEARFLVTSRERLRLDGECVVPLGPLGLPDDAGTPEESDAFRLLLDRVRRVRHGFRLGEQDVAVAARIVAELDGIPLAIELAAPRLAMLGARGLLERMTERLRALDSGSRGAKPKRRRSRARSSGRGTC
jgi:predicted ATPase